MRSAERERDKKLKGGGSLYKSARAKKNLPISQNIEIKQQNRERERERENYEQGKKGVINYLETKEKKLGWKSCGSLCGPQLRTRGHQDTTSTHQDTTRTSPLPSLAFTIHVFTDDGCCSLKSFKRSWAQKNERRKGAGEEEKEELFVHSAHRREKKGEKALKIMIENAGGNLFSRSFPA